MIFAVSGLFSQRAKAGYEETLGKVRMTNLGSMCEYFRDISAGLRLLAVSADDSVSESLSYIEARVMGARSCLNGFNTKKVKNISRFLDTVNKFTQNFAGTSEKRKIAIYLSEYAQEVYYHLNDISSGIMNGAYSLTEYGSIYRNDEKPYFEDFADYSNGNEKELFDAAAPASATQNIYYFGRDKKITEESAKEIASSATGINAVLWRNNESESRVYSFRHGDTLVDVDKSGMICRLINPVVCSSAKISFGEAEEKANEYLEKSGYRNLTVLRREKSEFTASFLFYPFINNVLLLTSPVIIEICMSGAEVVYLDSCEYIKNFRDDVHAPEEMPDISMLLPENLTVTRSFCCLKEINGEMKLCVLSICRFDGNNYYVYTDPKSLKILKTENV